MRAERFLPFLNDSPQKTGIRTFGAKRAPPEPLRGSAGAKDAESPRYAEHMF
jgi:hypothetical protein